jgi:hypothetical protein
MKKIFALLLLSISTGASYAQVDSIAEAKKMVRQTAIYMGDALLRRDFRSFVLATTHPKIMEKNGGGEKMIKDMEKQMEQIDKSGNTIVSAWPGEPSNIIDTAGEWQCTIPQYMRMKLPAGYLNTETTLVGISPDKGKSWYFIDAADQTLPAMRKNFPSLSSKLVIPPPSAPKFEPGDKKK